MSELQRFRTDIQGLRALAIIPVVLYHSHETWVPGGYVGVDVFFVISGYLITRIILKEVARESFSVVGFYERRVKRLFPALFLLLAATAIAGFAILPPPQLEKLASGTLAALFFVANLFYLRSADYFTESAEYLPLIHTWSLAVEEQFYIFFPLLVFALRKRPRTLLGLTLAGGILSLTACVILLDRSATAAFYLPFTRAYELLIGSAIAIGLSRFAPQQRVRDAMSVIGLALLAISFATFDDYTRFPGFAALVPCLGSALIILAGQDGNSLGGRLISARPLVFFGNISYSLYLWHWPVLVYARYMAVGPLSDVEAGVAVALAVLLAWLSYRFVERPVLAAPMRARTIFAGGAVGTGAIVAAALAFTLSNGFPNRFKPEATRLMAAAQADISPRRFECHYNFAGAFEYRESCELGVEQTAPTYALWGDSFGVELAYALGERLASKGESVRQLTASACSPALDGASVHEGACTGFNQAALDGLIAEKSIRTVVIAAHYLAYPVDPATYARRLGEVVERLEQAGKSVLLVYPIPTPRFDAPSGLALQTQSGRAVDRLAADPRVFAADARAVTEGLDAVRARTGASALRPQAALCGEATCAVLDERGRPLYFDDRHLSLVGARRVIADLPL